MNDIEAILKECDIRLLFRNNTSSIYIKTLKIIIGRSTKQD